MKQWIRRAIVTALLVGGVLGQTPVASAKEASASAPTSHQVCIRFGLGGGGGGICVPLFL